MEIEDRSKIGGPVIHPFVKQYPRLELNFEIPAGLIVAINADKSTIYNTYPSSWAAAKQLGVKHYRSIHRHLGQDYLATTPKGSFYFTATSATLEAINASNKSRNWGTRFQGFAQKLYLYYCC